MQTQVKHEIEEEKAGDLEVYTERLDSLIAEFSKLYEQASETSCKCKIRSKLIQGLSDGLSH